MHTTNLSSAPPLPFAAESDFPPLPEEPLPLAYLNSHPDLTFTGPSFRLPVYLAPNTNYTLALDADFVNGADIRARLSYIKERLTIVTT